MDPDRLLQTAKDARSRAYAPYSKFRVGAALLAKSGEVYTGCNVENSSYGLTMCAERVALFKAVSEGEREFEAIAVAGPEAGISCCGACRQALSEFGAGLKVHTEGPDGGIVTKTIGELLPSAFDKKALARKEEE